MKLVKRLLLFAGATGLAMTLTTAAAQDSWPDRSVKIISPYGAGGPNDISARVLADRLSTEFGQTFVVENKTGAGTIVANNFVAKADPDGYTILYAAAPFSTLEALHGSLSYDPKKDLKAVAMVATVPLFLIVNANSPYKTVDELIKHGKSDSDGLTIGSPGHGSLPHLAAELFLRDAGTKGIVVHYKGDVAAYTDLVAGRVDATLTAITAALPHIQAGKLRVLGVASDTTSGIYPDARPLKDQGLPNVVAAGWYGFMVPSGTPDDIVQRLDDEVGQALDDPSIKKRLVDLGMDIRPGTSAQFAQFIQSEMDKWGDVIKHANLKAK
ncbi:tripartite tricarboxylate transporter substrate binding protein [Pusillimonas sp. MFBS29]|uniref:Bug family tripartite tricarboxylate transporter substrate binding protein n=1 Tax=Pusillimonas sp. MFBS29 TaxID=2886690 RepID=UPI001D129D55|nr:tripartite tricarboxylate transporter substrate binding protein [Pusillimonas sp. MFBS29]MCC2595015.1 tripartite tricarboxylate transporter substrate binding protein [Pusillimonas sp. MFBS29]